MLSVARESFKFFRPSKLLIVLYSYEDAIYNATVDYSGYPTQPLSELEVFTGSIFSASGVQTRRQRDRSLQLKDEFECIARWTENLIRRRTLVTSYKYDHSSPTQAGPFEALMFSMACLEVSQWKERRGNQFRAGRAAGEYQSCTVVSACCAMKELDTAAKRVNANDWYNNELELKCQIDTVERGKASID